MTPKQFEKRAIALCRGFWPETENKTELPGLGSCEFTWSTGLRVNLHFRRKYQHQMGFSCEWIHFGLHKLGEEKGRQLYRTANHCWWKWNISYSGPPKEVRVALIEELERRLNRCVEVGAINKLTGEAKA